MLVAKELPQCPGHTAEIVKRVRTPERIYPWLAWH